MELELSALFDTFCELWDDATLPFDDHFMNELADRLNENGYRVIKTWTQETGDTYELWNIW